MPIKMGTIAGLGRAEHRMFAMLCDARAGGAIALAILLSSIVLSASLPLAALDRFGGVRLRTADFVAFYCGSRVAGRFDPYRTDALEPCERQFRGMRSILPAPLPPYDLLALRALSCDEPARARYVWFGILVAALIGASALLQPVVGVPWPVILGAFAIGTGRDDLYLAQIVPLVVVAVAGAAWYLHREMPERASACALLALFEPHLGVAAIAALVTWVPRSRVVIALGLAALAGISIAIFGWSECLEYVRAVLPTHALAEASFRYQYSLTYLLSVGGVASGAAVALGTLSFVFMLAAGVALVGSAVLRTTSPGLVVLLPTAFVVLGGAFVKQQQLVVAVPLCFALLYLAPGRTRWFALAAFFLVTLAWEPEPFDGIGWDAATAALAIAVIAATMRDASRHSVALAAGAVAAFYAGASALTHGRIGSSAIGMVASHASSFDAAGASDQLASYAWGVALRADAMQHPLTLGLAFAKILSWGGLLAMVWVTLQIVRSARPPAPDRATIPSFRA